MRRSRLSRTMVIAAFALPVLSGCTREAAAPPPPRDPVIGAVLQEPLMTDPDLVGLSQAGAVFTLTGPASAPIPLIDRGDRELAAARAAAAQVIEGGVTAAPDPAPGLTGSGPGATLAATADRLLGEWHRDRRCAGQVGYTALWAARLPEAVPVYPRGHVTDAAGTDAPGCRLRAVTFLTPVPPEEVTAFYWNLAGAAGLGPRHDMAEGFARVEAHGEPGALAAYVRPRDEGTEVTLVTAGF